MTSLKVLEVESATRSFDGVDALSDVSFALPHGKLVGLVGPNGSGKSTLVNCITGLDRLSSGSISVAGHPYGSRAAKKAISFAPDELPLPELLTGREYVQLICELERRDPGAALELTGSFELSAHLDKLLGSYSHGMKRRIQFSTTLSSDAPLIIMDEPFSGLDIEAVVMLRASLRHLVSQGRTVLVTIHDVLTAERECDLVVVLSHGAMVACGTPDDITRTSAASSLEDAVLSMSGVSARVGENIDRLIRTLSA